MVIVQENVSVGKYNTFGIDQKADYLAEIKSREELQELLLDNKFRPLPKLILGGGSNILFSKDYNGLVVINKILGVKKVEENQDFVWLKVGSGVVWQDLVEYCVTKNYGGIENLSLIPGTVGASPVQNIGAYGVEAKETIQKVEIVWIETGKVEILTNEQCKFAYRDSIFKHELKNLVVIISVTFKLKKNPDSFNLEYGDIQKTLAEMQITTPSVESISKAVIHIRQSKLPDPTITPNAGSFFKNPEIDAQKFMELQKLYPNIKGFSLSNGKFKVPAGWLIESCGLKGFRNGNVGIHPKQALVIVNYGGGNGKEILDLAKKVQLEVEKKFGILLEMEVNMA
jgi:UDP-N-acetylmuramate dehydrogenase